MTSNDDPRPTKPHGKRAAAITGQAADRSKPEDKDKLRRAVGVPVRQEASDYDGSADAVGVVF